MPYYETVFISRQDISSAQVDAISDAMAEIITGDGGRISRREYWGLKSMAYRMKKNKKGHYVLFNYEAPSATMREMERLMGLNEDVLRLLTLRTDDLPEEPSVVMANRNERGGRYGRDRPRSDRDDSSSDSNSSSSDGSGTAREGKGDSE
ncbi:MAG: 30S ribosomal protein S6 [Alphaproteobacteria bacterium]